MNLETFERKILPKLLLSWVIKQKTQFEIASGCTKRNNIVEPMLLKGKFLACRRQQSGDQTPNIDMKVLINDQMIIYS